MADVIIVGGGISGTAAAYELARAGAKVTLFEKGRLAGMASGWTLGGVRQSGRHPAELPLARAAVATWATLGEELGADVEYRRNGNLRLARTPDEVEVIRALVRDQKAAALDIEFLPDNRAVRGVAPALSERILAASFCASDGHANPEAAVHAFAAAARRCGADIRAGVRVERVAVAGGRVRGVDTAEGTVAADIVVIAAGVHANELLSPLGLKVPMTVPLVDVIQTEPLPPLLAPVLGVANADCAGRQEASGRLRFTGGLGQLHRDVAAWQPAELQPTAGALSEVIGLVSSILPAFGAARVTRVWGGLIDLTPDALPVIERASEVEGLVLACGFSGHGFCLGPVTGKLIADLALGCPPRLPLDAFRRARFAGTHARGDLALHG
ncbi:MAG: FAD-binding oxidoreductase [Proteobacteria bacterium]|nr:FAD-binding oxidoreductase [Pseudomonadota bacterium]